MHFHASEYWYVAYQLPSASAYIQVLDEADRMLTPTFAPELNYLFSVIPIKRQTCLFTATVSPAIMALAEKPPTNGREKPFVYRVESEYVSGTCSVTKS